MRKAWPALAIGAIVSMTRLSRAETTPLPLELEWEAPDGCPDATVVRRRIEKVLRGPLTAANSAVARGKIERTADGHFHLALAVRTGEVADARTIDAAACATLAEAFAVVVALAIGPTRDADDIGAPPPAEAPSAEPAEPPSAASPNVVVPAKRESPAPRAKPPPSSAPASRFAIGLGLGASVAWGALPEPSAGLVASASIRIDRFRVGALGTLALRQSPHFDRTAGASIDMIEGGVFGAYMVPLGIVAIGPSANIEATYVRVRGFGIRTPWDSSAAWPTAVVGGRFEARTTRWLGLFARADLLFPIDAPRFALGTSTDVVRLHSPAAFSPRLTLGAEIVLP